MEKKYFNSKILKKISYLICLTLFACLVACNREVLATNVLLDYSNLEVPVGSKEKIEAVLLPANTTARIYWSSSDPLVATVNSNGEVEGLKIGEATITANAGNGVSARCNVKVVGEWKLTAKDVIVTSQTHKGFNVKLFASEKILLDKISKALGRNVDINSLKLVAVDIPDNSAFKNNTKLKLESSSNLTEFFGKEQKVEANSTKDWSKKISFKLRAFNTDLTFNWVDSDDDLFTLPEEKTVKLSADDFSFTNINTDDQKLDITLTGLKTAIEQSINNGSGTINDSNKVKIAVKNNGTVIANEQEYGISDEIKINITFTCGSDYSLTFDIGEIKVNSETIKLINEVVLTGSFPALINLEFPINPLFLSVVRETEIDGTVTNKASVMLNHGGEIAALLWEALDNDYTMFDFDNATWSGKLVNKTDGTEVAKIEKQKYKERYSFDLSTDKEYDVQLKDAFISAYKADGSSTCLKVKLNWSNEPEKFFGDSIKISNKAEFEKNIYIGSEFTRISENTEGAKEYALVIGDDFNYHFNGLNYTSWAAYNVALKSESGDKEIKAYNRMWYTDPPVNRRNYAWDSRALETKNSVLHVKNLAGDAPSQTVYIGHGKTKAVKGFVDLNDGGSNRSEVLSCVSRTRTIRFGYVEAKVRSKYKAYNNRAIAGPWYAFWLYGEVSEYDCMEFTPIRGARGELCTHWHNAWGGYGPNPGSMWAAYTLPKDPENEWWTLGFYWDEDRVVYSYNGKVVATITKKAQGEDPNGAVDAKVVNGINNGSWYGKRLNNVATRFKGSLKPAIAPRGDEGRYSEPNLKGIMDVPVGIYLSTECGASAFDWNGAFEGAEFLPTWLEADYCAYYLPKDEVEKLLRSSAK